MNKGVAKTARTLIIVTIMITFFGIYLYMANNYTQISIKLNLESLEATKLKNTFMLFNRSMDMTWFITTAQIIFRTADDSIGCGWDDTRIDKGYWYMGFSDRVRDIEPKDQGGNPKERIPSVGKYNAYGMNPQICYPRDNHATDYMKMKLAGDGFLDIKTSMDADGVELTRENPYVGIDMFDTEINASFNQMLGAKFNSGTITYNATHNQTIYTPLRRMMASGRGAVDKLLTFGDMFYNFNTYPPANDGLHYMPNGLQGIFATPNNDSYKTQVSAVVRGVILASTETGVKADVSVREMELSAGDGKLGMMSGSVLIAKYEADVRYSEPADSTAAAPENPLEWPTTSRKLNSCFGYRTDPINDAGKFHGGIDIAPSVQGATEPLLAIKDGTVVDLNNKCTPTESQGCDKPGYTGYGNFVLIQHDNFYSFYGHMNSVSVTAGQSVSAGMEIGQMGTTGRSTGVHVHFETRKDGTTLTREDPCNYIDCSLSILEKCSGLNMNTTSLYYYHDEDSNKFEKRPVTLEFKARDYLPALSCLYWSKNIPVLTFNLKKQNDMLCCGGYIFTCDAEIKDLGKEQSLGIDEAFKDEDVYPRNVCYGQLQGSTLTCTPDGFKVS